MMGVMDVEKIAKKMRRDVEEFIKEHRNHSPVFDLRSALLTCRRCNVSFDIPSELIELLLDRKISVEQYCEIVGDLGRLIAELERKYKVY